MGIRVPEGAWLVVGGLWEGQKGMELMVDDAAVEREVARATSISSTARRIDAKSERSSSMRWMLNGLVLS